MTSSSGAAPPEAVGPLTRGLGVLRTLALSGGRMPASELVRAEGLARATVDRVVGTLEAAGHVRLEGREAVLAPRLMELGNAYLASCRIPDLLGPEAEALAGELDESVSLAVPDLDGVRFVHRTDRRRAMSVTFRVGDLLPAERCAPGALFAEGWDERDWDRWRRRGTADPLDEAFPAVPPGSGRARATFPERVTGARDTGWAVDDQLIEPGLAAVAVPVRDPSGAPVCAVSVVSHTSRHGAASLAETALPRLGRAVALMEEALGTRPAPAAPASIGAPVAAPLESLVRGLAVMAALGGGRPGLTLSAVAEATGLPRATVRRALITLRHLGYAASSGRLFHLTPRVLDLGFAHLSGLTLSQIAQPHLTALVAHVRESASMSVLDGRDVRCVARVSASRVLSVDITAGARLPAHATSMGRVLLAGTGPGTLAEVEDQGFSQVEGEPDEGVRSIAVPVRDASGRVIAAVDVAEHTAHATAEQARERLLPPLLRAAAGIQADARAAGRYTTLAPH
ncbi:IclR family transcriptional regulator domain-containing protein [Spirillospora sp. CA-294931]|uniref:IclR family transcriptional regulator domain-containing protein n=1 Tax=Spirillospora sp. CA-294931 TaxID=3240042 RepID=UPI003D90ED3C